LFRKAELLPEFGKGQAGVSLVADYDCHIPIVLHFSSSILLASSPNKKGSEYSVKNEIYGEFSLP